MGEQVIEAFVGVGSNVEPDKHIPAALDRLRQHVHVTAISTFYRTAAIDRPDQPSFLNGVWRIETTLEPRPLKLDVLRRIETELGRIRTPDKYAPRTIDLDVIVYGNLAIVEPDLRIPDPDIHTRAFLAIPLLELAPDLVLADTGESLASIARALDHRGLEPAIELTERLCRTDPS